MKNWIVSLLALVAFVTAAAAVFAGEGTAAVSTAHQECAQKPTIVASGPEAQPVSCDGVTCAAGSYRCGGCSQQWTCCGEDTRCCRRPNTDSFYCAYSCD